MVKILQDQYAFIHDAVLESLMCGDTHIPSADFCQVLKNIKKKSNNGKTALDKQFQVFLKAQSVSCTTDIIIAGTG